MCWVQKKRGRCRKKIGILIPNLHGANPTHRNSGSWRHKYVHYPIPRKKNRLSRWNSHICPWSWVISFDFTCCVLESRRIISKVTTKCNCYFWAFSTTLLYLYSINFDLLVGTAILKHNKDLATVTR